MFIKVSVENNNMIKKFKNIHFVGTSHVSKESIKEVDQTIKKIRPKIIALELDESRLRILISKKQRKMRLKDIKKIGFKGFIFGKIAASIEKKIGKMVGSKPGTEMKTAIKLAKKQNSILILIDKPITKTLKEISKNLTWKEKIYFFKDFIKTLSMKKITKEIDLRKVPSMEKIDKLTKQMEMKYPSIYKALITDRDKQMSKALYKISQKYSTEEVVTVVGAGHLKGIISNLRKEKWEK
jgi:pheromone shutdown-related protein TraB